MRGRSAGGNNSGQSRQLRRRGVAVLAIVTQSKSRPIWAEEMTDDKQRSKADAELEREIREGRKFTLAEAIGRLAGPGAGEAEGEIGNNWVDGC